jgi:4a-hydroxytetrahydrobiopterin dehydratase
MATAPAFSVAAAWVPRTPMPRRKLLSEEQIAQRLRETPAWTLAGKAITRTWTFNDFPPALAFINRVGELAEAANHHPDIYNSWATVRLNLTTHDAGGLTDRDFDLAKKIDALG